MLALAERVTHDEAASTAATLIDIGGLALRRGDRAILHDVRLRLRAGEIYGLLGPNGAGKSTTIAAIIGLLPAHSGTIRVLGQDPRTAPASWRGGLGVLPEQNGFYDWMTAPAYLAFFAGLHRVDPAPSDIAARLEAVGLATRPGQSIGTFSRGMRQRLGLARALIGRPALLILDEPTNGLDPRGRRDIHDLLIGLARAQGVGVLLCTHLLDDVERLCDRVGILVAGRTAVEGPIGEVRLRAAARHRYRLRVGPDWLARPLPAPVTEVAREAEWRVVDLPETLPPDAAWRTLVLAGWPILEVRLAGDDLQEIYLGLTQGETE